ncbi:hypothetical protein AAIH52_35510, partial [Pseudomonas aeruginosa]|uniref:hypothetical protein n=1 Tax=Pseudomonas aeruginosa TaxID=287 RepID=UPI0031B6FCF3
YIVVWLLPDLGLTPAGSGRGCFYEREEEGRILFSTHLEEGRLDIYINGFAFGVEGRMRKLLFSEVVRIVSHLSIEMFSSAGDQAKGGRMQRQAGER